jgi:hypothetical protein
MTSPSLLKRLEALESIQVPRAPVCLWKPYQPTLGELEAFETELAATKAAHPGRPVIVISWGDAA